MEFLVTEIDQNTFGVVVSNPNTFSITLSQGIPGTNGTQIRYGSGAPNVSIGSNGDSYIDIVANALYGPKTAGVWGSGVSLVGPQGIQGIQGTAGATGSPGPIGLTGATGAAGPTGATGSAGATGATGPAGTAGTNGTNGANGTNGTNGTNGATFRDGAGAPSNALGSNGDYYLNDTTADVYLKSGGTYSIVANIKGATGATGTAGSPGAAGAAGPNTVTTSTTTNITGLIKGNGSVISQAVSGTDYDAPGAAAAAQAASLQKSANLSDVASASTSRTNLGLGSMATQNSTAISVTGGAVDGTTLGATTAASGKVTTLAVTANGAANTPAELVTGIPFTGGTTTTTKPLTLIETAGATSTNWSTSGTMLGVNAPSGFTGNLGIMQLNGVNKFTVDSAGNGGFAGGLGVSGNLSAAQISGTYMTINIPANTQGGAFYAPNLLATQNIFFAIGKSLSPLNCGFLVWQNGDSSGGVNTAAFMEIDTYSSGSPIRLGGSKVVTGSPMLINNGSTSDILGPLPGAGVALGVNATSTFTVSTTGKTTTTGLSNTSSTFFTPTTSAAASLTLGAATNYVFTGSTSTWTLPSVASSSGQIYEIKNRGTGALTISRAGTDNIYDTGIVTSYALNPGYGVRLYNDGTYFNVIGSSGSGTGSVTTQNFSGNGSTTVFTLTTSAGSAQNVNVYISGVYQQKSTYTVSGTTLTFSTAPPTGTNNIEVLISSVLSTTNGVNTGAVVSAASTLTLADYSIYSFSGTTATWTLPTIASTGGHIYFIKNRGSGTLTINSNAGGNDIYNTSAVATLSVLAGNALMLVNDTVYWSVE